MILNDQSVEHGGFAPGIVDFGTGVAVRTHGTESVWRPSPIRTRKVAILGFGRTVRDCPWRDDSWELWAMNGFHRAAEPDFGITAPPDRYALWFDLHTLEYTRAYGKAAGFGDQQERWLREPHPFVIFTLDEYGPEYPSTRAFPIGALVHAMGRDYFTSTVAYAIAYAAMLSDVAEIGLWGIDLIHDTEYADQRPCAEYWLGRAEERGIKITRHANSAVLHAHHRYGYEQEHELILGLRERLTAQGNALDAAIRKRTDEVDRAVAQNHTDNGALQMIKGLLDQLEAYARGGRIA